MVERSCPRSPGPGVVDVQFVEVAPFPKRLIERHAQNSVVGFVDVSKPRIRATNFTSRQKGVQHIAADDSNVLMVLFKAFSYQLSQSYKRGTSRDENMTHNSVSHMRRAMMKCNKGLRWSNFRLHAQPSLVLPVCYGTPDPTRCSVCPGWSHFRKSMTWSHVGQAAVDDTSTGPRLILRCTLKNSAS